MSTSPKNTPPKTLPHDALEFLAGNHKALLAMFRDYEHRGKNAAPVEKGKEALRLCHRLSIHCAITEEHFYPAVAAVLGQKAEAILDEAEARLGTLRGLISNVEKASSGDASFEPAMKALGTEMSRHFEADEKTLFPLLRHADFDRAGTGERLATRQAQLSTAPPGKAVIREARRVLGATKATTPR
jgi:Hemerythrin HHE cation binding domain